MNVELRQSDSGLLIDRFEVPELLEVPQPGRWLVVAERSFLVLQRHHRYQLRAGRYELSSIALQVKPQRQPADARFWQGRWVIGDPSCHFNARTPLLRCAVLPDGPCERCSHYAPASGLAPT